MDNKGYQADGKGANTFFKTIPMERSHYQNPNDDLNDFESEEDEGKNYEDDFEDLEWEPSSFISRILQNIQLLIASLVEKARGKTKPVVTGLIFLLYNAYLVTAIAYNVRHDEDMAWCNGLGFLIIITAIVYWSLLYYFVIKKYFGKLIVENVFKPVDHFWDKCWKLLVFRVIFGAVLFGGLLAFLIVDSKDNRRRLISAAGIPVLILIGLVLSKHPSRVVWRHIFWGIGIQFVFGLAILRWDLGRDITSCLSDKVSTFLDFTKAGSHFVFGFVAAGYNSSAEGVETNLPILLNPSFAFGPLSVIFFFSFFVAILYNMGAMTWLIVKLGWLLEVTMGTTAAESMSASANIFLGVTEAPLVVKPFLKDLTNSELHSILTGGFASIAGTVMGAFISFGISASHLLSASFMSAPAALAFAKLMHPETKVSRTTSEQIYQRKTKAKENMLDAASAGASQAISLVANIIANLIAITAFVAFLDAILGWFGMLVGFDELSFQWILGKVFYPIAWILGVDPDDVEEVAILLGVKTVLNEFVAYEQLTRLNLSERSTVIATYALCSFSNFSTIGNALGGMAAMEPLRRKDFSKVIWRAFIAGNAAALLTACIAGTLTN